MSVRGVAAEVYRETLPVLAVSTVGGLVAGVILGEMGEQLAAVPGLLVLVPALLATRGNVYGALGARLGTALHQGVVEPRVDLDDERLRASVTAAMVNGVTASAVAAVGVWVALSVLAGPAPALGTLLGIAVLAGVLSGLLLTVTVVTVMFAGFRRGLDPDTLVGPIVTTAGDVFGMGVLLVAVWVLTGAGP